MGELMEAEDARCNRSFRSDDYHYNRRVFLRSYPLQWEEEDEEELDRERGGKGDHQLVPFKRCLKSGFLAVFHWGQGKLLILRRLKKKVVFYVVACQPFGFKPSDGRLISF